MLWFNDSLYLNSALYHAAHIFDTMRPRWYRLWLINRTWPWQGFKQTSSEGSCHSVISRVERRGWKSGGPFATYHADDRFIVIGTLQTFLVVTYPPLLLAFVSWHDLLLTQTVRRTLMCNRHHRVPEGQLTFRGFLSGCICDADRNTEVMQQPSGGWEMSQNGKVISV